MISITDFLNNELHEFYSYELDGDEGIIRFDLTVITRDRSDEGISIDDEAQFICRIHQVDYSDVAHYCEFEDYEVEEFDHSVFVIEIGELTSTYNPNNYVSFQNCHWEETLKAYYFDLESAISDVKYELERFVRRFKNLEDYEYQFAATDKDYDNLLELVLENLKK